MRFFRPFPVTGFLYPEAIFRVNTPNKELYLTFDDGPSEGSTTRILKIVEDHKAKVTFFCNGLEAEKNVDLVGLITSKGHIIGNHGYQHLRGWKTNLPAYIENVNRADKFTSSILFRPPYGSLRPSQYNKLAKKYRIVFWDLLSYDFDKKMTSSQILKVLKRNIRPGSIIVFHDNPSSTLFSFLEDFLEYAENEGYVLLSLPVS